MSGLAVGLCAVCSEPVAEDRDGGVDAGVLCDDCEAGSMGEVGGLDVARGAGAEGDADFCAACGEEMGEMLNGEACGGLLCADCEDGSVLSELAEVEEPGFDAEAEGDEEW